MFPFHPSELTRRPSHIRAEAQMSMASNPRPPSGAYIANSEKYDDII